MTTEQVTAFLDRYFGSHERPAVLHAMMCRDYIVADDGTELHIGIDDEDVSFDALVADVWVSRNEKMGSNVSPAEWVELFDYCKWPLGDEGARANVPLFPLTVYRCGHPDGMSWTTSFEVAQHFQKMRPHNSILRCVVTDPFDVLGVFYDRKESEVALRPDGSWRATVTTVVSSACPDGEDVE